MLEIRKTFVSIEEVRSSAGNADSGPALRKVAACAVVNNPFAGQGYVQDMSPIIDASGEIGTLLGSMAADALGAAVESYGKGGVVGISGEQEHINAALTSVYGNAFRDAIGGGQAWITSATKLGGVGTVIDIPLAFKDEIWVRSHYDAMEVRVPEAPLPNEMVIIAAVANRGRLNARVGGMSVDEAKANQS